MNAPRNPPNTTFSEFFPESPNALSFAGGGQPLAPTPNTRTLTHMGTNTRTHIPHGDRRRYVHGRCRCAPCRAANTEYQRNRNRAIARPDTTWAPHVSATEAATRIAHLRTLGLGLRRISEITGIARSTLTEIANGTRDQVTHRTLAALRAADPVAADGTHVDATRATAALAALANVGWTPRALGQLTGHNTPIRVRGTRVRRCTEHRILTIASALGAVIDEHGNTLVAPAPPTAVRS